MEEQSKEPSSNGGNGRDPRSGRFVKGNSGGPGNPKAHDSLRLRQVFRSACSDADLRAICRKLVIMARKGNLLATREILERVMGKSEPVSEQTGTNNSGNNNFMPVFEVLVKDRQEVLELDQLKEMMRMQLRQANGGAAFARLPAPTDD
jgi:hypothetical protein